MDSDADDDQVLVNTALDYTTVKYSLICDRLIVDVFEFSLMRLINDDKQNILINFC